MVEGFYGTPRWFTITAEIQRWTRWPMHWPFGAKAITIRKFVAREVAEEMCQRLLDGGADLVTLRPKE